MKKTITTAIMAVLIFSSTAFAGGLIDAITTPGQRTAWVLNEVCYIPYNVDTAGFQTGIHILPDFRLGKTNFIVAFFNGGNFYARQEIVIGPEGWSGLAGALLPLGQTLQTPTVIVLISTGTGNGRFWATQFIFTEAGFSHVLMGSEPAF